MGKKQLKRENCNNVSKGDFDDDDVVPCIFVNKYRSTTIIEIYEELLKDLHLYEVSRFKYEDDENYAGEGQNYEMDIVGNG